MIKKTPDPRHKTQEAKGFSLTEVLIAVGILAVGMLFVAGAFPVSIHFTTVAAERTIAATVADEAFAKIKLYGIYDPNVRYDTQINYEKAAPVPISDAEFAYPSTPTTEPYSKKFWWSAICKRVPGSLNDVQVTVFVSRKVGMTTTYVNAIASSRPVAVGVGVSGTTGNYDIAITGNKTWINDGYTIVYDATGQMYRVLERYLPLNDNIIRLDKPWQGGLITDAVWVVSPPVNGGRYPCIGVYQKVMRF